jgi:hypothetical protein
MAWMELWHVDGGCRRARVVEQRNRLTLIEEEAGEVAEQGLQ